jgi:hypothetical protein
LTIDLAVEAAGRAAEMGIPAVALFPVELKTADISDGPGERG